MFDLNLNTNSVEMMKFGKIFLYGGVTIDGIKE